MWAEPKIKRPGANPSPIVHLRISRSTQVAGETTLSTAHRPEPAWRQDDVASREVDLAGCEVHTTLVGSALGGLGPLELSLEAHVPGVSEDRPEGLVGCAFGRAEVVKDDQLGVLEHVPVADNEVRVGRALNPEEEGAARGGRV